MVTMKAEARVERSSVFIGFRVNLTKSARNNLFQVAKAAGFSTIERWCRSLLEEVYRDEHPVERTFEEVSEITQMSKIELAGKILNEVLGEYSPYSGAGSPKYLPKTSTRFWKDVNVWLKNYEDPEYEIQAEELQTLHKCAVAALEGDVKKARSTGRIILDAWGPG